VGFNGGLGGGGGVIPVTGKSENLAGFWPF